MAATMLTKVGPVRRSIIVVAAGAAIVAAGFSGVGPASAVGPSFSSEWADVSASGQDGTSNWSVTMAPGSDEFNGEVTEYLKTKITTSYCEGGFVYETTLEKTEQAKDLKGVQLQALNGTATVARKTTLSGTQTKTASDGCVKTGAPTTQPVTSDVVLRGSWSRSSAAITYTGTDCGGTGRCTYFDARSQGSVRSGRQNLDVGVTGSKAWLWHGTWDLSA